jgi:hypothetical protein
LLHNKVPVVPVAVNTEFPQLLTTATVGTTTVPVGAAVPLPAALVQPFTVCVIVYVVAVLTVIDAAVDPLLHNNVPVTPVAVNNELPQLFTTVTPGADGTNLGAATPVPAELVHPLTVCVTVNVPAELTVINEVVAPLLHKNVPEVPVAVNTELPQLLATVTTGASVVTGAAIPLPAALVQPFIV